MKIINNHVRCTCCKYARTDKKTRARNWKAIECGNSKSNYFGQLLNIDVDGEKLPWIAWPGCEHGVPTERRDAV